MKQASQGKLRSIFHEIFTAWSECCILDDDRGLKDATLWTQEVVSEYFAQRVLLRKASFCFGWLGTQLHPPMQEGVRGPVQ